MTDVTTTKTEKLTRQRLSQFIRWTTSCYNERTKPEVMKEAWELLAFGSRWLYYHEVLAVPAGCPVRQVPPKTLHGGRVIQGVEAFTPVSEPVFFSCGSYTPCSAMNSGGVYRVDPLKRSIALGHWGGKQGNEYIVEEEIFFAVTDPAQEGKTA